MGPTPCDDPLATDASSSPPPPSTPHLPIAQLNFKQLTTEQLTSESFTRCKTGKRITKAEVRARLWRSAGINLAGIASTLLGLQATVGLLVAKTLTNATANPFLSGGSGSYNPVLALDVFLV